MIYDLKNEKISKLFFAYLLPSVTGSLAIGILIFIDTVFIGRGVGSLGLAALNTVLPVFTLYSSLGLLFGIGGATLASIISGRGGNKKEKNIIFSTSVYLSVFFSIIFTLIQKMFLKDIIYYLGATELIFPYAESYLRIISTFTAFYIVPNTLNIFIRNDSNPNLSMWAMVSCGISNILLDYLFIFRFNMGMRGASLATGISQFLYFAILLLHFFRKNNTLKLYIEKIKFKNIIKIVKIGIPSFINDVSSGLAIFIFNLILFKFSNELYVSAFSIILNINFLVYLIYVGVSQGTQPIISYNYGAKLFSRIEKVNKYGLSTNIIVSIFIISLSLIFPNYIVGIFNKENQELIKIGVEALPRFFSASLFMGINIYLANFFQGIEQSKISSLLIFMRAFLFLAIALFILPKFLGINGVWYATLFSELATLIFVIYFYKSYCKKIIR